jgi:hypothetical protein
MSTIKVQVANPTNKQVKQVTVGKMDASTVTLQSGTTLIYDATTGKFEAANTIDGGTY